MKKSKDKITKTHVKKASAPRSEYKRKKKQTGDEVKEMFGVHIISDADIEHHFGTSESDSAKELKNEQ